MFSVIIPLYNKADYINKTIESVLAQTYREFELIIVNDGSTDNSLEIVQNIDFTGIDVRVIDQKNSGVSVTRNNGAKIAKYDFVAFLDADDWWSPAFLEEISKLIVEFPDAALYATSYYKVKNGKNFPAQIGVPESFDKGYFDYCKAYSKSLWMPIAAFSTVIRKTVFIEQSGFKPPLKFGEDFDLWIRIALRYKVVLLNTPLVFYNQDVDLKGRAVGKLYKKEEHMLFNLDYLNEEERENPDLKQLLDNLRVNNLFPYYLKKHSRAMAWNELKKVDWDKQSPQFVRKYKQPIFYLKIKYWLLKRAYNIKQRIVAFFR